MTSAAATDVDGRVAADAEADRRADAAAEPELSVVVVAAGGYPTIRKTMRHLRVQEARERFEVLIVTPSAEVLGLDRDDVAELGSVRTVEAGAIDDGGRAKAAAVRAARAPVVAFVEDHSYPDLGWAKALIEAHRGPWAAVGPVIANANPGSMTSWADLLMDYGRWLEPRDSGEVDSLPGHNSSYKRDILLQYGDRLESMLERESELHRDLIATGHHLYLESRARVFHLNVSRLASSTQLRFNFARLLASERASAAGWSPARRMIYMGGSPLIPMVYLRQLLRETPLLTGQRHLLPRLAPALLFSLATHGLGELAGFALGRGDAYERMLDIEFHRHEHLSPADRRSASVA